MQHNWNINENRTSRVDGREEFTVVVGLILPSESEVIAHEHLDELEFLALTAGALTIKRFVQKLDHPDSKTFVGKGKVAEIKEYLERHEEVNMVIFDDDLSGKQTQILEEELKVKIVDRSSLILDIFASRARTAQSRTQVELAQLQYLLPRLRGLWTHLERQRGGIGMRGPGEQEIETDRRIVREKIAYLKKKLEKIDEQNKTRRKTRDAMIRVALVGYTNAGKSTLMNVLSKSDVFAENKLFATLDTTVRKVVFGTMPFLLSDTVGFIRKLPHHLVESFKSTLDETRESDILVHVVDVAHPQFEDQMRTVIKTLHELGSSDLPMLTVLNKIDLYRERYFDAFLEADVRAQIESELVSRIEEEFETRAILISAEKKENLSTLRSVLAEMIEAQYAIRYPYRTKTF
ncbi:MAG TPA: GTPase HflX [Saprospiraceae bacterium]|nr:GTPase HflX [Saprospiraceae bacterium]